VTTVLDDNLDHEGSASVDIADDLIGAIGIR
jgi:hypothetical protein